MKIVQLDIQGFRSLKNVSWRPGDLNVVIGPNGSGKSNLLRMLELISAAAKGKMSDSVQTGGGISALVWDGDVERMSVQLEVSKYVSKPDDNLVYLIELTGWKSGLGYYIEKELLKDVDEKNYHIERLTNSAKIYGKGIDWTFDRNHLSQDESVIAAAAAPFNTTLQIAIFQQALAGWAIYHDIRTDLNAPVRQAPVSRLEQRVAPDGQNLINVLHTLYAKDRKFEQDINDAMFAAFGEDYDKLVFPPDAGDQRVQMRVRWKTLKRDQSTADLSDGTLRFLFLITVLAAPNPPPLIAIDEPETGLHPSMLPIIAEFAVEASRRTQVIFTTHSDQFLDAFRDTKPTTTVAKWENGETTLTTLNGEELEYWLKDYSLGRLFRSGELENMAA